MNAGLDSRVRVRVSTPTTLYLTTCSLQHGTRSTCFCYERAGAFGAHQAIDDILPTRIHLVQRS